jgi:hypothetical protein
MADATFADLFGSDILLHYDVSDASKLFTDTGGTSVASNGNEVKCVKASADAAKTGSITGTNGPTYRSNYASSGYPALEFDGSNDRLGITGAGLAVADFMVLCCFTRISGTASTVWYRGTDLVNLIRQLYTGDAGHQVQYGIASSYTALTISGTVTGRNVWASAFRTGQVELDSMGFGTGNRATPYGGTLGDAFYLGAGESGGVLQPANMAFNEILVIGSLCEWGQVIRAGKIMRNKWGISDPNALPQTAGGTSGFTGLSGVGRLGT